MLSTLGNDCAGPITFELVHMSLKKKKKKSIEWQLKIYVYVYIYILFSSSNHVILIQRKVTFSFIDELSIKLFIGIDPDTGFFQ